ncbi:response regulator transcription factor [Burkholderia glumae]|uniref:response regulator transcription factor n=1 Tax=Burkholderia glumae TaxID=337 RepID=UPI001E363AF9|nr:LuxR C-terminal-related transcriptional regulator [Burkholderia glumae]
MPTAFVNQQGRPCRVSMHRAPFAPTRIASLATSRLGGARTPCVFDMETGMSLTLRESAVLELIALGNTDREIAARLGIATSTARKHRENLLLKFQAKKSAELVMIWFRLAADAPKGGLAAAMAPLTPRQIEILSLLAHGFGDKQIARRLKISDQTARTHRPQMLRRAQARNVCELIFKALDSGWIAVSDRSAAPTAFDEWSEATNRQRIGLAAADFPPALTRRKQ